MLSKIDTLVGSESRKWKIMMMMSTVDEHQSDGRMLALLWEKSG